VAYKLKMDGKKEHDTTIASLPIPTSASFQINARPRTEPMITVAMLWKILRKKLFIFMQFPSVEKLTFQG
jgi:hypothetical protein